MRSRILKFAIFVLLALAVLGFVTPWKRGTLPIGQESVEKHVALREGTLVNAQCRVVNFLGAAKTIC
ncbi:MAG: hypothetical protein WA734_06970 [Candidatus Acidiferrales bacterium]